MSDINTCDKCGRENTDNNQNWAVLIKRGRVKTATCPSCVFPDDFAASVHSQEAHGFIYDPVTDRIYGRPRDISLPRVTFTCECGFLLSDSGDDVQEMVEEHKAGCRLLGDSDD